MKAAMLSHDEARTRLVAKGWLAACPPDFSRALLDAASLRHLATGETLYNAGEPSGGIWGIAEGQLGGVSGVNSAAAPLSAMFMAGEWAGTGPMTGYPRIASVMACAPSAVMMVPQTRLRQMLNDHPVWWEDFSRLQFLTVLKFGMLVVDLQLPDSRARLAAIILNVCGLRQRGDERIRIAVTQEQLGAMANLSRHPAGEILRQLCRQGLVAMRYGQLTIIQPAALRAIANAA